LWEISPKGKFLKKRGEKNKKTRGFFPKPCEKLEKTGEKNHTLGKECENKRRILKPPLTP